MKVTNSFGFRNRPKTSEPEGKGAVDFNGLPKGPIGVDPVREQAAVRSGEALGFTDRGQGRAGGRRRPDPVPTKSIYIKGPEEIILWFEQYTNDANHKAFWNSLDDFRKLLDERKGQ